jgi:hypothetical protein
MPPSSSTGTNQNPPRETRLERIVERHRLPFVLIIQAIAYAPDLLAIPWVSRYEVWLAIAGFIVWVIVEHLSASSRAPVPAALAFVAVGLAVLLITNPQDEPDPHAEAVPVLSAPDKSTTPPAPKAHVEHLSDSPIATLEADSKRWVGHDNGDIDRLDSKGRKETTFHVTGPIGGLAACGGALVVTHGSGKVARVSPTSGRILQDYPYSRTGPDPVICGGRFIWVAKTAEGSVVKLSMHRLRNIREYPLAAHIDDLAYGHQDVWVIDRAAQQVVGLRVSTAERLGPYAVDSDAERMVYLRGSLWILHRTSSCLRRFDLDRRLESTAGAPLGSEPWSLRVVDGEILIADRVDGTITKIDPETGQADGRPVVVARGARLTDADGYDGLLFGVDNLHDTLVTLGVVVALAQRRAHAYRPTSECPTS